MRILLTGATGFIGRHLLSALHARGHALRCVQRTAPREMPGVEWVRVDFARQQDPRDWLPHLHAVDLVINTVGILRETGAQTFQALHVDAPLALFRACIRSGVPRVLQVSALGADPGARTAYAQSKYRADEALLQLPLQAVVVQPSLVFGPAGRSAALFATLASLPLIPLPGAGLQAVQPVHIDDVIAALTGLAENFADRRGRIALVGPEPLALRDLLSDLRQAMDLGRPRFLPLPSPLIRLAARAGRHLPATLLDEDTLAMLERGNVADVADTAALLGRPPRAVRAFIPAELAEGLRAQALQNWALPLLRGVLALVWLVTAALSFGLYPVAQSYALLERVGIGGAWAPWALYGAATLNLLLGLATLWPRRMPLLWLAQMALILGYTLLITLFLPEFWRHPYGPVLKNLPLLAILLWLYAAERRG